jgi:RNA polymerase sigma factor (sigma-70 family)
MFFAFIIVLVIAFTSDAYLTPQQQMHIRRIMADEQTSPPIRSKVRHILIHHYLDWTIHMAKRFAAKHQKRLQHVSKQDLQQYAIHGLVKAVAKYDGRCNLPVYAEKYIMGSLYYGLTDLTPLKPLNHYERFVKKIRLPLASFQSDAWFYDGLSEQTEGFPPIVAVNKGVDLSEKLATLPAIYRQTLYYRYDPVTYEKARTIREVGVLMGVSCETVRKRVRWIRKHLQ